MEIFDLAEKLRLENMSKINKPKNTNSTTQPTTKQEQQTSSKSTQNMELPEELHIIKSYCKDLYQQRDEGAEKISPESTH